MAEQATEDPSAATEQELQDGEPAQEPEEDTLKETEEDAPIAKGPKIKEDVTFNTGDITLNCMPSAFGNMLMPLSDGGLQYLLAGARANVGLKSGRYMFEVKILEHLNPAEDPSSRQKTSVPRNHLRVGFSTQGSSLFLGDTEHSVCFNSEGAFMHNQSVEMQSQKFGAGDVVAVLLNLDRLNCNFNTVSLFKNGERVSKPQPLPAQFQGKVLYPAVTFKNVTLHYNFGPVPILRLPFKCHMTKDALMAHAVGTSPAEKQQREAKKEVLFPVCLPDEGTFDWLDLFLEQNKQYLELSDRSILAWAEKSGLRRRASAKSEHSGAATELVGQRSSNDRPEMGFGIGALDDGSVRRVLHAVAPVQDRSYVVMEVRSNLVKEDRRELLSKWTFAGFKRTAAVMMGEPPISVKKRGRDMTLKEKQEASDKQFRAKKAEEKRKRMLERKQRELERSRKKAEKAAKKKQEALKKKLEERNRKAEKKEEAEQAQEGEGQEAEEEEKDSDEEEKEDEEMEAPEEEPPKVELTAEEKKQWFRKPTVPDLSSYALSTSFQKFSLPGKDEAFEQIRYDWYRDARCEDYLKQWVRDRKLTTRVEDLQPSEWFSNKCKEWHKTLQAWHAKQNQYKALISKKAANAAKRAAAKEAKKEDAEKGSAAAKQKEVQEQSTAEGAEGEEAAGDATKGAAEKEEDTQIEAAPEEEEPEEQPAVDFEGLDVFGVEDILDIGGGQPLFSAFTFEDWTMMSLRFELYLLCHAFKKDVNDPDRVGMHLEHLPFYYNKYYRKALNTKFYGVETVKDLLEYVKDSIAVRGKIQVVEAKLPPEMESWGIFAMLAEESRRDRMRRIDLGDDSARLKLSQQQQQAASGAAVRPGVQPTGRTAAGGGASWSSGWKGQAAAAAAWASNGTAGGGAHWQQAGGAPAWSQSWRSWGGR